MLVVGVGPRGDHLGGAVDVDDGSKREELAVRGELKGVSTRRVDGLVKTLGIESLSKSQVSRMAARNPPSVVSNKVSCAPRLPRACAMLRNPRAWIESITRNTVGSDATAPNRSG
jgi:hypothetical protein